MTTTNRLYCVYLEIGNLLNIYKAYTEQTCNYSDIAIVYTPYMLPIQTVQQLPQQQQQSHR